MVTVTTVAKSISGLTRTEIGSGVSDFTTMSNTFVDATSFTLSLASEKFCAMNVRTKNSASTGFERLYINLATDIFSLLQLQSAANTTEVTHISDILANTDAGTQTVQLSTRSGNVAWTETVFRDDSGSADNEIATFWEAPNAISYQSASGVNAKIEHGLKINITQIDANVFSGGTAWRKLTTAIGEATIQVMANAFGFSITQFQSKTANLNNVVTNGMIFDSNQEHIVMLYDWAGTNIRVT